MASSTNGSALASAENESPGDYDVSMAVLHDPKNRPVRVITIGAGMSGIMSIYKIQQACENVEHVVYEKNPSVGGTWFENRYPGYSN
jgi:hypothetical protein